MVSDSERTKILEMIESGTITAEQGLTLLNALSESGAQDEVEFLPEEAFLEEDWTSELPPAFPGEQGDAPTQDNPIEEDEPAYFEPTPEVLPPRPDAPEVREDIRKWKRWWVIPLWIGAAVTVISGLLMFWAYTAGGFGFWFACTWFPFLLIVIDPLGRICEINIVIF